MQSNEPWPPSAPGVVFCTCAGMKRTFIINISHTDCLSTKLLGHFFLSHLHVGSDDWETLVYFFGSVDPLLSNFSVEPSSVRDRLRSISRSPEQWQWAPTTRNPAKSLLLLLAIFTKLLLQFSGVQLANPISSWPTLSRYHPD
jgi:hypothetical protein